MLNLYINLQNLTFHFNKRQHNWMAGVLLSKKRITELSHTEKFWTVSGWGEFEFVWSLISIYSSHRRTASRYQLKNQCSLAVGRRRLEFLGVVPANIFFFRPGFPFSYFIFCGGFCKFMKIEFWFVIFRSFTRRWLVQRWSEGRERLGTRRRLIGCEV